MLSNYTWATWSEHKGQIEISDPDQNLGFTCIFSTGVQEITFLSPRYCFLNTTSEHVNSSNDLTNLEEECLKCVELTNSTGAKTL